VGAPSGKKWATNALGLKDTPEMIIDIHRGSPNDKVKIK
jgi:hypothetical protein